MTSLSLSPRSWIVFVLVLGSSVDQGMSDTESRQIESRRSSAVATGDSVMYLRSLAAGISALRGAASRS